MHVLGDRWLLCWTGKVETISSKFCEAALVCVSSTGEAGSRLLSQLRSRQRRDGRLQPPPPLSALRDLFNAAFVSCWSELNEDQQDELIRSIELALTSQDIAEVTQTLLNLAEFMEHSDKVSCLPTGQAEPGTQPVGGEKHPQSPLVLGPCLPFSYVWGSALLQGPLPLRDDNGIVLLGERAAKCRAYAKALHYKELEFQKGPTPAILESLIR